MKVDKEEKPLCHVAMVAKFLDLNTTVFLQIWYETTKKIDLYDFPPMIAHRNSTATK